MVCLNLAAWVRTVGCTKQPEASHHASQLPNVADRHVAARQDEARRNSHNALAIPGRRDLLSPLQRVLADAYEQQAAQRAAEQRRAVAQPLDWSAHGAPGASYAVQIPGLAQPFEKHIGPFRVAITQAQGKRRAMEDAVAVRWFADEKIGVVAVLDGHGGRWTALKAAHLLPWTLYEHLACLSEEQRHDEIAVRRALKNAIAPPDPVDNKSIGGPSRRVAWRKDGTLKPTAPADLRSLQEKLASLRSESNEAEADERSGTTATIAVFLGDSIYIVNVGDSRAVLVYKNGTAQRLSMDQKPCHERPKLERRGDKLVIRKNQWVILSNDEKHHLNVSRSLGDFEYTVSRRPQVSRIDAFAPENLCLLIGSDGIFDTLPEEIHAHIIHQQMQREIRAPMIGREILAAAYQRGSMDNMTAVLVPLHPLNRPTL